jgi:TPR repeat protein
MSRVFHASCALIWAAVATSALWSQAAVAQPKPAQQAKPAAAPAQPKAPADAGEGDVAYAAFQRGLYLTAFREATKRVDEKNDPKAMTLLGELYADGLGVPNDDKKANDWYKLAAARGDREATFALAMFRLTGRAGPADRKEGARLLGEAAKLGHIIAAYDLALLYLEGQLLPQDFTRAAELMKTASDAGNPQAQYALATFYKEGTGVPKDPERAVRLLQAASLTDNVDAEGICHRAVQRHRHAEEPAGGRGTAPQGVPPGQRDRAEPAGLGADQRHGHECGQDRGFQVAPGGQDLRQGRSGARQAVLRTARRRPVQGRGRRQEMARDQMT